MKRNLFDEWEHSIMECVERKISLLKNNIKSTYINKISNKSKVKVELEKLKNDFVIVPIDKVANNIAFISKQLYAKIIVKELISSFQGC